MGKRNIIRFQNNLVKSLGLDSEYSKNNGLINKGIALIFNSIADGKIKYDKIAIMNSIIKTNRQILDKEYYTTDSKGKIIPSKYTGNLKDLVNKFNNNPLSLNTEKL